MNPIFMSILIPSFNQGDYLKKCLESIFNQSFNDFEVIVLDNVSSDKTRKILIKYKKKYKNQFRYIIRKDKGQADAINYGINIAKGDYITWQNCDDYYYPGTFKLFNEAYNQDKTSDIIYGNINLFFKEKKKNRKLLFNSVNFFTLLSEGMVITNQSCIWKRKVHNKIGLLRNYYTSFDYEWFLRLSFNNFKFKKVNSEKSLACFLIYKGQKSYIYTSKDNVIREKIIETYHSKSYFFNFFSLSFLKKISRFYRFLVLLKKFEFNYIFGYFFHRN